MEIAQGSDCVKEGNLTNNYNYNPNSKTWWIDLDTEKEWCNPACVVEEYSGTAEINWRCMGILEINSFDDCVNAGNPIVPPTQPAGYGYRECRTSDGKIFFRRNKCIPVCKRWRAILSSV